MLIAGQKKIRTEIKYENQIAYTFQMALKVSEFINNEKHPIDIRYFFYIGNCIFCDAATIYINWNSIRTIRWNDKGVSLLFCSHRLIY